MQRPLAVACVAICVAIVSGIPIPDDVKAEISKIKAECLAEHPHIDEEHLKQFKEHVFVEGDEELKKFALCVGLKAKFINADGGYNRDVMKDTIALATGHRDHDKDVDECTKEDHHGALENSWALVKCLKPKLGKDEE